MSGADLKAWRARNGYSQETLARAMECTSTTISNYECDRYMPDRQFRLALAALERGIAPVDLSD